MTHLPYIVASYALGVLIPAAFAVAAFLRMRGAQRRLAAIDPRVNRPGGTPARSAAGDAMTRKRRRLWILLACGLGLGSATALALSAFRDNLVFFLAPSDLAAKAPMPGRNFRLGGLVEQGSVQQVDRRRPTCGEVPRHRRRAPPWR